jgi:hypothetical protein
LSFLISSNVALFFGSTTIILSNKALTPFEKYEGYLNSKFSILLNNSATESPSNGFLFLKFKKNYMTTR